VALTVALSSSAARELASRMKDARISPLGVGADVESQRPKRGERCVILAPHRTSPQPLTVHTSRVAVCSGAGADGFSPSAECLSPQRVLFHGMTRCKE